MPEEVIIKVEEDSHSSPETNLPPNLPQAEAIIQAAIQTGAASEKAEKAAAEATQTLAEAENLEARLQKSLAPQLEEIANRLAALEAEAEEIQTEKENSMSNSLENADIVSLEIPRAEKKLEPLNQQPKAPEKKSGGLLKKMFLNL